MNDESTPQGASKAVAACTDYIAFRYAAMFETACRTEYGLPKLCASDAFEAGRAVGYQLRVEEECSAAWPLACYVTGNGAKSGLSDRTLREMWAGVSQ